MLVQTIYVWLKFYTKFELVLKKIWLRCIDYIINFATQAFLFGQNLITFEVEAVVIATLELV